MEIKNLFATLLESVTIAHKLHLETNKYSKHKSLDEYYEDFPDIIDTLIETYQGKYDVVEEGSNEVPKDEPIPYFESLYNYAKEGGKLFKEGDDSELLSCMDDVYAKINQTLYQLKKLDSGKKIKEGRKMKTLSSFLNESLYKEPDIVVEDEESGEITSEEDFREYAENKFKEVFGDELDEDQMNETIDGILSDNQDLVESGDWGELIGMLNKSFGS